MTSIDEPRNPFASEDLANAIKKATDDLSNELGKIGEQMQTDFPFLGYDDVYPEYGGRMKLKYDGVFAVHETIEHLIENGYEVSTHLEVASEVEREVDGIDKWIVIEFDEVE